MPDLKTDTGVQARRNALKNSAEASAKFKAVMDESAARGGHGGTAESMKNNMDQSKGERGLGTK